MHIIHATQHSTHHTRTCQLQRIIWHSCLYQLMTTCTCTLQGYRWSGSNALFSPDHSVSCCMDTIHVSEQTVSVSVSAENDLIFINYEDNIRHENVKWATLYCVLGYMDRCKTVNDWLDWWPGGLNINIGGWMDTFCSYFLKCPSVLLMSNRKF